VITKLQAFPCLVSGAGRPLVILAGLFPKTGVASMHRVHAGTIAPYARRRRVHYLNRREHLRSGMTIGELAAEHAQAMRTTFDGPVDVLGLSTGGSIAQQLAADHPDVVRRLALLSTGCRLSTATRTQMRRIAARIRNGAPRRALALAGASLVPDGPWQLPAAFAAAALARPGLSWADLSDLATTIELEDTFDLQSCSSPIRAPTLVIASDRDRFYPTSLLEQTASLIPDARLILQPGHGHTTVTGLPEVHEAILTHLEAQ
jgi:pimeloyl-ACP methyl ester carboxylesterase